MKETFSKLIELQRLLVACELQDDSTVLTRANRAVSARTPWWNLEIFVFELVQAAFCHGSKMLFNFKRRENRGGLRAFALSAAKVFLCSFCYVAVPWNGNFPRWRDVRTIIQYQKQRFSFFRKYRRSELIRSSPNSKQIAPVLSS